MLLFAFDLSSLLSIFASKFSKLILRFNVRQSRGVRPAFGGLISQINGTFRHRLIWHALTGSDVQNCTLEAALH
jgi:hypothetical protein